MRKFKKMLPIIILVLIYVVLKIYVLNTETKEDDSVPDVIKVLLFDPLKL